MAFTNTISTKEGRAISLGVLKMEIHTWTTANTDTSGTITAATLTTVLHAIVPGLEMTSAIVYATNTAVLAFTDPGANVVGELILFGR